uniref:Fyve finger-containing phosphoinositide kinase n=1 Tax=Rhizophora mucronata TaxID=61149 RepID=A0A2P2JRH2_RHIMU
MVALTNLWVGFCEIIYLIRITDAALVRCHQRHMFIVIPIYKAVSLYLLKSYLKYFCLVKRMERSGCGIDA